MPDICIYVSSMELQGSNIFVQGQSYVDGNETQVGWGTTIGWNDTPAQVNSACVNAAIAEVENALSIEVTVLDNRTLLGGAVGLL